MKHVDILLIALGRLEGDDLCEVTIHIGDQRLFAEIVAVGEVTNFSPARRVKCHRTRGDEVHRHSDLAVSVNDVALQEQLDAHHRDDFQHEVRRQVLEESRTLHQLSRVVYENLLSQRCRHRLENLTLIKVSFAKHVVEVILQFGPGGRRQFVLVGVLVQLHHQLVVSQR